MHERSPRLASCTIRVAAFRATARAPPNSSSERRSKASPPPSFFYLYMMVFKSDGVPKNAPLAMMWAELAVAGGQPEAFEWEATLMRSLTASEREDGWRLVSRWRETHRNHKTR